MAPKQRRTQAERRAETIARLVDATISTLSELGYARISVKEICARAGVSHGALFGRFPTLLDLVLAAAEEVANRQLHNFALRTVDLSATADASDILPLLRQSTRDPINTVWVELQVAARTDRQLYERLHPIGMDYLGKIIEASRHIHALQALPAQKRTTLVTHIISYFDGETLSNTLNPDPELDANRMALLITMVNDYLRTQGCS